MWGIYFADFTISKLIWFDQSTRAVRIFFCKGKMKVFKFLSYAIFIAIVCECSGHDDNLDNSPFEETPTSKVVKYIK
jgi:hypothetical protein